MPQQGTTTAPPPDGDRDCGAWRISEVPKVWKSQTASPVSSIAAVFVSIL